MAKFIIISKSFALDILVTGIGHMVDPKRHSEPISVLAMQIYEPPIYPSVSGSPGGHTLGLHPARPGLHPDGAARPAKPGEASRPGPCGLRGPGHHPGGGGPAARTNGRGLPVGHCDGLLPAGVPELHRRELSGISGGYWLGSYFVSHFLTLVRDS